MGLLDFIYPKRCVECGSRGEYVCAACFSYVSFVNGGFCAVCQRPAIGGITHPGCRGKYEIDGVFASVVYAGVVKRLVYRFKYKPYLLGIGQLLVDFFYEGLIQNEVFMRLLDGKIFFTAIPLHRSRLRERGYNQSEVLGAGLAERLGKRFEGGMLTRVRQTAPQFGLSQKERLENMRGAFVLREVCREDLGGSDVVFLVDDIVTGGATFREAAKVLKRAGAGSVYGVAFAHGQ